MMSNGRIPPPTHYQGGPAAAADAAFCSLRERRRGSVVSASPLGGAGPVALLWCGGDRQSAPPLFQMFPAAALGGSPPIDPPRPPAQHAPGARVVGSMPSAPCVPNGGIGNAPGRGPGQFPTAPPLGSVPGCPAPPGNAAVACGPSRAKAAAIRPPLFCALRRSAPRVLPILPRRGPPWYCVPSGVPIWWTGTAAGGISCD